MTKMFENAIKAVRPKDGKEDGVIPGAYDMGYEDFSGLLELLHSGNPDDQWKAIVLSFEFGFVMGNRCTIRRKLRRL